MEMMVAMKFSHPNIVKYYGYYFNDAGQIVLVLERASKTLVEQLQDDRIKRRLY